MRKKVSALLLAAALALNLAACGGKSAATPAAPAPESPAEGSSAAESPAEAPAEDAGEGTVPAENNRPTFLAAGEAEGPLTPSVSAYTVEPDFSNVINYSSFEYRLNDAAKAALLENGFVVHGSAGDEFFTTYEMNRYGYIPNFVTTDSMMHTYHLYFSRLLKGVEKDYFISDLTDIGTEMQAAALEQYAALKGTEWENAALRNVGFFTVGLKLLDDSAQIPAEVAEPVNQELAFISEANQIADSPLMNLGGPDAVLGPLQEDYTQYIPRGYYAAGEDLSAYFRAMMWYGRLSFRQNDTDQSRSALLMTLALENSEAMQKWEEIYTITSFFVGASDDPGIYEYAPLIEQTYGSLPAVADLPGNAAWDSFAAAAAQLAPPAINSIPVYEESVQPDRDAVTKAFRFMGQRFTLDASIFQRLVYREVDENSAGDRRMLPDALDIPAALGSNAATQILLNEGANDYKNYTENMDKVKTALDEAPVSLWSNSLYMGWLNTLRPLVETKGEGWPQFMQNAAWEAKSLNTFEGSWTELKHDTILYAKQVYAEMGGGPVEPVDDRGYVEPEAQLYNRLALLCRATADGLEKYGVLRDDDKTNLGLLSDLAGQLDTISRKELQEEPLTDEEYELIRTYGGQLEHFWTESLKDEKNGEKIDLSDFPAAVVADVATDPNGSVLEVGTGSVENIFVVVNVEGSLRIAQGCVYSFYQFEQPIDERLTDETWRQMLGIDMLFHEDGSYEDKSVDVERPTWVQLFRVPTDYE